MLEQILEKIKKEKLIENEDRIVLGFSGGPDSVFLLEFLNYAKDFFNLKIVLAHINHMLRGDNSDGDEKFCTEVGKKLNLPVYIKKVDVNEYAKINSIGLEEAGREIRYEFFNEILYKTSSNKIAIAHNIDDQIENFLFRLIRGTSLDGLEGISSRKNIIRPINEISKKDILEYLSRKNIKYRVDETNLINDFTRNSIRLDLIPFIEKRYNNKFRKKIYNLITDIKDVNEILQIDMKKYEILLDNQIVLDSKRIKLEKRYIQRKIINEYLKKQDIYISREKILDIIELLNRTGSKILHLSKKKILKKEYDYFWVEEILKNKIESNQCILETTIPFNIKIGNYCLEAVEDNKIDKNNNEFLTNLDKDDIITIRTRKAGDKIKPIGMNSYKKIKDIFINERVPKDERDLIPLLFKDNELIWIAGIKKSENFKCKQNKKGIKLIVRRQNVRKEG